MPMIVIHSINGNKFNGLFGQPAKPGIVQQLGLRSAEVERDSGMLISEHRGDWNKECNNH